MAPRLGRGVIVSSKGLWVLCVAAAVGELDTPSRMTAALRPDLASACPNASCLSAWWPGIPRFAVGAAGMVLMHAPHAVVQCSPSGPAQSTATVGRLISTF